MRRIVHGVKCPWASCPWGESCCLWSELSLGQNDQGEVSWGEFRWSKLSLGRISMGRVVRESAGQFRKEAGYFCKEDRTLQVKRQDTTGKKIEYYRNEESKMQEGSKELK
jgi:hypothetical protein